MHVELTSEQVTVLVESLETEVADLRMEIAHCDAARFKEGLRTRKDTLASVLQALREQAGVAG
jgi:hypothetical protein